MTSLFKMIYFLAIKKREQPKSHFCDLDSIPAFSDNKIIPNKHFDRLKEACQQFQARRR